MFSVSLVRRRLLFLAAAATNVRPCGQCHPSGTSQEAALPYTAPLTEGIGVHMYRYQHTGEGLLGHKKCHTLDTCDSFQFFVLMHMGGMVLADKLGDSLSLRVFT